MKIGNFINGLIIVGLIFLAIKYSSMPSANNTSQYKTANNINDSNTSVQKTAINPKTASKYNINNIPQYVFEYSKKFSLWKEIFYGSKIYIVYSYQSGSTCTAQSQKYHDDIANYVSQNSGYFADKPISPSQFDNDINKGLSNLEALYHNKFEEYANNNDQEKINQLSKEIKNDNERYQNLIDSVNACTLDTCIIDPKNKKYIKTDRDFNKLKTTMDSYKSRL